MAARESIELNPQTYTFVGGVAGLVTFLAFGLLPSLVYGGYAGVMIAAAIFGTPLDGSVLIRAIIGFGMVVGLLSAAGLFVIVGSIVGTSAYLIGRGVARRLHHAPAHR